MCRDKKHQLTLNWQNNVYLYIFIMILFSLHNFNIVSSFFSFFFSFFSLFSLFFLFFLSLFFSFFFFSFFFFFFKWKFCSFLSACLADRVFPKRSQILKERICSLWSKFFLLRVDSTVNWVENESGRAASFESLPIYLSVTSILWLHSLITSLFSLLNSNVGNTGKNWDRFPFDVTLGL